MPYSSRKGIIVDKFKKRLYNLDSEKSGELRKSKKSGGKD